MKFLNNIFAFLIPLLCMLISFSLYLIINNVVENYKIKISHDYSIVVISSKELINIHQIAGIKIQKIENLPNEKIIENIKTNLSKDSLDLLRQKLPFFYQIYLQSFPTSAQLEKIKKNLLEKDGIKNVEIFYKNHNQLYVILLILNNVTFILFSIITLFSIFIIAKQIKLWFHEYQIKISILRLHGASILYSASTILSYALFSAFLAFIISSIFLIFISNNLSSLSPVEIQELVDININLIKEISKLFVLSFFISIFTIIGVLFKYKINND